MSGFPDFTALDLGDPAPRPSPAGEAGTTPEGIAVKASYGAADAAGLDFPAGYPGIAPFLRGPYPTMYLTNPWTIAEPSFPGMAVTVPERISSLRFRASANQAA